MQISNMCLVLKFDNGKVVSIANEQTESCQHPVPYYNIDLSHLSETCTLYVELDLETIYLI